MTRLSTFPDAQGATAFAAHEMAGALRDALTRHGSAQVALSGGNTPRPTYDALAGLLDDWSAVELWYGDERCVGPDDPESTHRLVVESLLAGIAGTPPIEHRVRGELGAEAAAQAYERELRARVAAEDPASPGLPSLDVALVGLGEDGHTASLFPGHAAVVDASGALCLAVHDAPKPPPDRVTLSMGVLRAARCCLMLVTGSGKAQALARVMAGPDPAVPASLLGGDRLHVVADAAAAASIRKD
ncbi:MAG TPA: 6-phosphogluconolactonase [Solirubrobacteraceae bacterium]|nr:6-phosphogluconolactonase [Solirubrobacteraceae bacterium]